MKTFAAIATVVASLAVHSVVASAQSVDDENPIAAQGATAQAETTKDEAPKAETTTTTKSTKESKVVVGVALGTVGQSSGFLFYEEHGALVETQVHGGWQPNAWIELGGNLELGQGSGLRSVAALAELKSHLFPMLPVNPTVTLGAGLLKEHGTAMNDATSGYRHAYTVGAGLESHIHSWTASIDGRIMAVAGDGVKVDWVNDSRETIFAHDAILAVSIKAGVSKSF